jgi:hypothetical protein
MKDAWEEEKQRLTAAIEREQKLRRDSEMRERRLLDDRLAEAMSEGGDGHGLKVLLFRIRRRVSGFQIHFFNWLFCALTLSRATLRSCRMTCVPLKGACASWKAAESPQAAAVICRFHRWGSWTVSGKSASKICCASWKMNDFVGARRFVLKNSASASRKRPSGRRRCRQKPIVSARWWTRRLILSALTGLKSVAESTPHTPRLKRILSRLKSERFALSAS